MNADQKPLFRVQSFSDATTPPVRVPPRQELHVTDTRSSYVLEAEAEIQRQLLQVTQKKTHSSRKHSLYQTKPLSPLF